MTLADVLARAVADAGKISIEEAEFVVAQFRAQLKGTVPEYAALDRELLGQDEVDAAVRYCRRNKDMVAFVGRCLAAYGRAPLPSA